MKALRRNKPAKSTDEPSQTLTIIGAGTTLTGKISVTSDLELHGNVEGEVSCDATVLVGEQAMIDAQISSKDVVISGSVQGDIQSTGTTTLTATAIVSGDINTVSLVVSAGAQMNGRLHMEQPQDDADSENHPQDTSAPEKTDTSD